MAEARTIVSKERTVTGGGVARLEADNGGHVFLTCTGCGLDEFQPGMAAGLQGLVIHACECHASPERTGLLGLARAWRGRRRARLRYAIVGFLADGRERSLWAVWRAVGGSAARVAAVLYSLEDAGQVTARWADPVRPDAPRQRVYQLCGRGDGGV